MSTPAERIWVIYHFDDDGAGGLTPRPDRVQTEYGKLAILQSLIGGVCTLATRRQEIYPGVVETIATVVRWRSFVPVEKAQAAPAGEQAGDAPPTPPPPGAEGVLEIPDEPIEVPPPPPTTAPSTEPAPEPPSQ